MRREGLREGEHVSKDGGVCCELPTIDAKLDIGLDDKSTVIILELNILLQRRGVFVIVVTRCASAFSRRDDLIVTGRVRVARTSSSSTSMYLS